MPKGLKDFEKTDEALRIRKSIEFNKNAEPSKKDIVYFIAYKGKKLDPITKTRKELEIKVENGELMKELLKTLGFQEILTVEKERELYEFEFEDYHLEALLDYLPMLKEHFMEVEALIDSNEKLNETRDVLFKFLNILEIKKEESIRKSYLELIVDRFNKK